MTIYMQPFIRRLTHYFSSKGIFSLYYQYDNEGEKVCQWLVKHKPHVSAIEVLVTYYE